MINNKIKKKQIYKSYVDCVVLHGKTLDSTSVDGNTVPLFIINIVVTT